MCACVSVTCISCVPVCVCPCLCPYVCVCLYVVCCACVSVFACVLPHLYSGVCCASVQFMCTFRGPDGDTMYSILGNTIHVQKAWYTNRHRISSQYKHAQVHKSPDGLLLGSCGTYSGPSGAVFLATKGPQWCPM